MLKSRGYVDDGLVLICALMALIALIVLACNSLAKIGCRDSAAVMGLEYKYGLTMGCMVKVDGRYFPLDAIRYANGKVQVEAEQ